MKASVPSNVEDRKTRVFISYSRSDRTLVQKLVEDLTTRDEFELFRDTDDILPSEEWRARLKQLIGEADTVIFCLSPHSAVSEECIWEADYAKKLNKRIIPVVVCPFMLDGSGAKMGRLDRDQKQLFYAFDLDEAVPNDHPVRGVMQVLDLSWVHDELASHYSHTGRPSIDPELMLRMLILGYVFAIRSERQLVREVQVNLAYRWFCGLGIEDRVPDHSAFSRARNDRFRQSNMLRELFERVVADCITRQLVGGEGFAVDASLIEADANKCRSIPGKEWNKDRNRDTASRAVREYLDTLDDKAFGAASDVTPKFVSRSDPAAQWTGAMKDKAFFAYADNYLIDTQNGIIMDVEATRAIRQAKVGASRTMLDRTERRFGIRPKWLAGDTAHGSAENLGWLVNQRDIEPHVPIIDKSKRKDGTFSREDFRYDEVRDCYVCPAGCDLPTSGYVHKDDCYRYMASITDCRNCPLKPKCCPNMQHRRIARSIHEAARDVAREIAQTEAFEETRRHRKKVENGVRTSQTNPAHGTPQIARANRRTG